MYSIKPFIFFRIFIVSAFSFCGFHNSFSNSKGHSLNKYELLKDSISSKPSYSFFISGHFHGSSKNTSGLPAKTLLKNIDNINAEKVDFLICLGDLFMDIKNDIPSYKEHLIDKLKFPIFNAPGNHDKSGDIYESTFGSTFFYFNISSELFLFFDTELNDGSITGEQMQMLKEALVNYPSAKNILVFTHRLIWAEENPKLKHLFNDNTRSANGNNFRDEVLPLLKKFGKGKKIYLFGGSLGAAAAPFFYFEEGNFTYIATAIRDTPKDAFLKVNVEKGHLNFKAFALSLPIENYDLNYYNSLQKRNDKFSWRLVPLYLKNMIFHRYFWYGIAFLGLPMLLIYFFRRKRV